MKSVLEGLNLRALFFDALDALGKGFSALELEWEVVGSRWVVSGYRFVPSSLFRIDPKSGEVGLNDSTSFVPLIPQKWLIHKHAARSGPPSESSLFRTLVWAYMFKTYTLDDWASFLEKFAIPTRIAKYPGGSSEE